jgi:hypothetical protein
MSRWRIFSSWCRKLQSCKYYLFHPHLFDYYYKCDRGTFAANWGQSQCDKCTYGTFINVTRSKSCNVSHALALTYVLMKINDRIACLDSMLPILLPRVACRFEFFSKYYKITLIYELCYFLVPSWKLFIDTTITVLHALSAKLLSAILW